MHLIWLSAVIPPMAFVVLNFVETRRLKIWRISFAIALLVLLAWIGFRLAGLDAQGSPLTVRTVFFTFITAIDLPLIALTVGCAINWMIVKIVGESSSVKSTASAETTTDPVLAVESTDASR